MSDAVGAVQSRIAEIQSRFSTIAPSPTATASGADFDRALRLASVDTAGVPGDGGPLGPPGRATAGRLTAPDGADVIGAAQRYLGVPYKWGGTDPRTGLDCSGFVQRTFADLGVDLPRVAADQAQAGTPVAGMAQARPGDLLAFGSPVDHIGIYAGDGRMIVAPRTGDVVRYESVSRTPTAIRRVLAEPARSVDGLGVLRPPSLGNTIGASSPIGTVPFADLFARAEQRYGLPSGLLAAVARAESSYDPRAVSPAGAAGLMQLMPDTARSLGVDPSDPAQAVDGAGRLLAAHLQRFGSVELALAAYNAGGGAVARYGGIPPYGETQAYVRNVLSSLQEVRA